MPLFTELKPLNSRLKPYIDSYLRITGPGRRQSKEIFPTPGAVLIFDSNGIFFNDHKFLRIALIGFHDITYNIKSFHDSAECIVIKFSPYGLSRFIQIPLYELTGQIVDAEAVFGHGIIKLYSDLFNARGADGFQRQLDLIEEFLIQHLEEPHVSDIVVFQMAGLLRQNGAELSLAEIQHQFPLSRRQIQRKFRLLIGVSMQTYMRICRFDRAKSLLIRDRISSRLKHGGNHISNQSLTEIGYEAGYYDQPHFSKEFKKLLNVSPRQFNPCPVNSVHPSRDTASF